MDSIQDAEDESPRGQRFQCPHPNCKKSFTRREHLSRHKLNHWPKEIYRCNFIYPEDGTPCGRTFVRRDLLLRHEKRHRKSNGRLHSIGGDPESTDAVTPIVREPDNSPIKQTDHIVLNTGDRPSWQIQPQSLDQFVSWIFDNDASQVSDDFPKPEVSNQPDATNVSINNAVSGSAPPAITVPAQQGRQQQMEDIYSFDFLSSDPLASLVQELSAPATLEQPPKIAAEVEGFSDTALSKRHSITDVQRGNVRDNIQSQKNKIDDLRDQVAVDESPVSPKQSMSTMMSPGFLDRTPSFFNSDPLSKYHLSLENMDAMLNMIPGLKVTPTHQLEKCIRCYWLNFHPQYPILHLPSFDIDRQPVILLLAMIMTGASYLGSQLRRDVSDTIGVPLRWIIFSHEDFQPPSETYIIQSLLLLECYEKTSTSRYLHERSYLHHGTTIQLLRRTPSLGGHPLRFKTERCLEADDGEDVYRQWIEFEVLKRTAFYAFYIDTTHAVVFGYTNLFINCDQVQLALPCSDEIWESFELSYSRLLAHGFGQPPTRFLDALKALLQTSVQHLQDAQNSNDTSTQPAILMPSKFGEKILLAGLISIMFQFQQQAGGGGVFTVLKKDTLPIAWQEIVGFAIDYWYCHILSGCTNPRNSIISTPLLGSDVSLQLLRTDDHITCKIPAYHMAQITMRIFQYDYYIYAGAPWRMNVKAGQEEYELVSRRICQFSKDPMVGGVTLIYAYQFLFEMFDGGRSLNYDVNFDYCITRPNTVALTTLLIWSYNFCLYGPESNAWNSDSFVKENYVPKESAKDYLTRMSSFLHNGPSSKCSQYREQIKAKALLLPHIPNTHHLCGLLIYMRDLYAKSYWELGREFSKLFDNCLERSMGRQKVICNNMYEV